MNLSSSGPYASICCIHDRTNLPDARCYWNASLFTIRNIFPRIVDPFSIPRAALNAMVPGDRISCRNDIVCYSDFNFESTNSTYLSGNGTTSSNDSMYGDLACRLDGREYCFKSRLSVGTENLMSVCKAFFNWEASATYYRAQSVSNQPLVVYPLSISLLFFLVTFVIYTVVPELRNLHGLILRTHMLCCCGNFLATMLGFLYRTIGHSNFIMVLWHFAFLSTFSWLNITSLDIWLTFRSLRYSSKRSPRQQYIIYSIYAWGLPMLIFGTGLIIEILPNPPNGIIKPIHQGYWLLGPKIIMVYVQIPVSIMVAANLFFFLLTAVSITRQKKATAECLEGTNSRRYNDEKSRFYLYLKLFVVMGMTWFEHTRALLIPMALPKIVLYILNLANMLQGLTIFILFVCNVRTKRLLSKRLGLKDRTVIQWIAYAIARVGAMAHGCYTCECVRARGARDTRPRVRLRRQQQVS